MRQLHLGAETFGRTSGQTLHLHISDPGECASLADFASRTILACSLVGYEIVAESPPRTLAEVNCSGWVAESIRRYAGVDLPPPSLCPLFALVENSDRLELAVGAGTVFVAFCWHIDREWQAWHATLGTHSDCSTPSE